MQYNADLPTYVCQWQCVSSQRHSTLEHVSSGLLYYFSKKWQIGVKFIISLHMHKQRPSPYRTSPADTFYNLHLWVATVPAILYYCTVWKKQLEKVWGLRRLYLAQILMWVHYLFAHLCIFFHCISPAKHTHQFGANEITVSVMWFLIYTVL